MKVLLESSKLAYSYYNADIEVKLHLQKKGEETKKMREAESQKKKDYKDDRNSIISSIQQVSPIWAKDILVTVLLVQVIGDGKFGGLFIHVRVWVGVRGVGIIFFLFFVLFLYC